MTTRRKFLGWLGLGTAIATTSPKDAVAKTPKIEELVQEVKDKAGVIGEDWKFEPYINPNIIGFTGYWYRMSSEIYKDPTTGKTNSHTQREIMAFETPEGFKIASPWALQVPFYLEDRKGLKRELESLVHKRHKTFF